MTLFVATHLLFFVLALNVKNALLALRLASCVLYVNVIKRNIRTLSFGAWFEPRYIFRAGRLD